MRANQGHAWMLTLGNRQRGAPLALQNVQTNAAVVVHVAMVDARRERNLPDGVISLRLRRRIRMLLVRRLARVCVPHAACPTRAGTHTHLRRFERVVCREVNVQKEDAPLVG